MSKSTAGTSRLDEIGARDGWRCWVCDEAVDAEMSVNDARCPSVDGIVTASRNAKQSKGKPEERLAHRGCNSKKGAVKIAIPWPEHLFVADPAPLLAVAERLGRKGGREVVARCPGREDAEATAAWLLDRFSRLTPGLAVRASIDAGGGQFLVALAA